MKKVYVTMVTPYRENMSVDYERTEALVEWYIAHGVDGIFAVCQSSEMHQLERDERKELGAFVVKCAAGRVPVVVSGHVSDSFEEQLRDISDGAESGAEAVVLVSNRLARQGDGADAFRRNLDALLAAADKSVRFGMYECPYPYKRLLSTDELTYLAKTGRFDFFKDTCCDADLLAERQRAVDAAGGGIEIYNANAATLLPSLRAGVAGYSGVMANFHPELYAWLCKNYDLMPGLARRTADFLSAASVIEARTYPVCAKYRLAKDIPGFGLASRKADAADFTKGFAAEVDSICRLADYFMRECAITED